MAVLETIGLEKVYGRRRVVDGVSLNVGEGEIVGLLGSNGAGKTTTFKMIVGLVTPTRGSILLRGEDISRLAVYRRARLGMGFLSQEPSVFQRLTVEQNLFAILQVNGDPPDSDGIVKGLLEEYGLLPLARQKAHTLSGGEKRRLEVCRALVTSPSVMLLDEPFAGVDPKALADLKKVIRKLKERGIAVLLTDHNVRETFQVTDRSYIIEEGCVIADGPPPAIVDNPTVRKKYLGEDFRL
jgi:lipopolysaccharide export system ATP-binding protein